MYMAKEKLENKREQAIKAICCWILDICQKTIRKISKDTFSKSLAATPNAELGKYEEALDSAFLDDRIQNIAITGPYGSGKSSIIETYKNQRTAKRFLHISLARFSSQSTIPGDSTTEKTPQNAEDNKKQPRPSDEEKSKISSDEMELEGKILNQLLHQIKPNRITQTSFKIKRKINRCKLFSSAVFVALFAASLFYILNKATWEAYILSTGIDLLAENSTSTIIAFAVPVYMFTTIIIFLYKLFKAQKEKDLLKRIKIGSHEVEVFSEKCDSYFNKYLNDVLYLFDRSGVDVIVFEDIDRFDNVLVFQKLREINNLVNLKRKREGNRKILHFVYLMRDDIFTNKDRTKFFDIIIPVVPVMDPTNAYNQFLKVLGEYGYDKLFDTRFLHTISLYIDEMRILKNICYEFDVYYHSIKLYESNNENGNGRGLNPNNLMAIIIYKNLFPKDFDHLHRRQGFIAELFSATKTMIKKRVDELTSEINKLTTDIKSIEQETLRSIDELYAVYIHLNYNIQRIGSTTIDTYKTSADAIRAIINSNYRIYRFNATQPVSVKEAFTNVENDPDFKTRKKNIEDNNAEKIKALNEKIQKLTDEIDKLKAVPFRAIIPDGKEYKDCELKFENKKHKDQYKYLIESYYFPVLWYFICNGYINEGYADYINHFYSNNLTANDYKFLRSIIEQGQENYTYSLNNPKKVFEWMIQLGSDSFKKHSALNFDLLSYAINEKSDELHTIYLLNQIQKDNLVDFISVIYSSENAEDAFYERIYTSWDQCMYNFLSAASIKKSTKHQFIIQSLIHCSDSTVESQNKQNCINEFIESMPTFLSTDIQDSSVLIDKLELLKIRFPSINVDVSDETLLKKVLEKCLYQLNATMIEIALDKTYTDIEINQDIWKRNYTIIASVDSPLKKYVDENFSEYIDIVMENCSDEITDSESTAAKILNSDNLSDEKKVSYLAVLSTQFADITLVSEDSWDALFKHGNVQYTVDNILNYFHYCDDNFNENLLEFISTQKTELKFNRIQIDQAYKKGFASKFYLAVLACNNFPNRQYKEYLSSLNFRCGNFSYTGLSNEKIGILLATSNITMNAANLKFIRENYSSHAHSFIVANGQQYYQIMNQDLFDEDEYLYLLENESLKIYQKHLLKFTKNPIPVRDYILTDAMTLCILNNNFDIADLPYILIHFDEYKDKTQKKIKALAKANITSITEKSFKMSSLLLNALLLDGSIALDTRKIILAHHVDRLSSIGIRSYLQSLQQGEILQAFEGNNPKIESSESTKQLLHALKENGYVSSFKSTLISPGLFRIYSKKIR